MVNLKKGIIAYGIIFLAIAAYLGYMLVLANLSAQDESLKVAEKVYDHDSKGLIKLTAKVSPIDSSQAKELLKKTFYFYPVRSNKKVGSNTVEYSPDNSNRNAEGGELIEYIVVTEKKDNSWNFRHLLYDRDSDNYVELKGIKEVRN